MPSEIEKVRTNIDIELACNYLLKQTPASRDRKHLVYFCPFHNDVKNPNLKINHNDGLHRGSYRCFACGENGDIFTLYQKLKGGTFPEAVAVLGNQFSCEPFATLPHQSKGNRGGKSPSSLNFIQDLESWPECAREWIFSRGITPRSVNHFGLAYAKQGPWDCIAIHFLGGQWRLRRYKASHPKDRYRWYPKGKAQLFGVPTKGRDVVLCEGEFDAIRTMQEGFEAVSGTAGAGTFHKKWSGAFTGKRVSIIYDLDEAGRQGAVKAALILHRVAESVRIVELPEDLGDGGDLTDYWQTGYTGEDLKALIEASPLFEPSIEHPEEPEGKTKTNDQRSLREVIENLHWTDDGRGIPKYIPTVRPERLLTDAVAGWFEGQGGGFFHDASGTSHLMFGRKLYTLDTNAELLGLLYRKGRVNTATQEGKVIIEGLRAHALAHGQRVNAFSWLYLDSERHTLYVNLAREDNAILRISPGKLETVPNGLNKESVVLSAPREMDPIEFDPEADPAKSMDLLWGLVVNNLACHPSDAVLAVCWTLGTFVQGYCRTRPILRLAGPTDAGKTAAAELLANLVFGRNRASISTMAANFSDASREGLLILDNLEVPQIRRHLDFLLTSATGITKRKRSRGTDTGTIHERAECQIMLTGIEPPDIPELQSRLYEVEFCEKYKSSSFVEEDAISRIRGNRGTILSGYFRLLAEEVLPRMAGGERKKQVAIFRSGWPNHSKARTNSYLAILWLILDAITKHRPLGNGTSSAGEASRWIERQDRLAAVGRSEGSVPLMYLNELLEDLRRGRQDRYTLQNIIKVAGGKAIGFEASHQQLLSNFKTLARDRGLIFPYDGTRQLAARLNGELGLLAKHSWSREISRTIRGTKYYLFRVDSSQEVTLESTQEVTQ